MIDKKLLQDELKNVDELLEKSKSIINQLIGKKICLVELIEKIDKNVV
jgi:hypothetical protein